MKHTAIDLAAFILTAGMDTMTDTERARIAAQLLSLNGLRCGRVLAVLPTDTPDTWQVSCMQDGAMDALVTYKMDARTGHIRSA